MPYYVVQEGIARHYTGGKYPFRSMEVGQTVHIVCDTDQERKLAQSAAHSYGQRKNWRFRTSKDSCGLFVSRII